MNQRDLQHPSMFPRPPLYVQPSVSSSLSSFATRQPELSPDSGALSDSSILHTPSFSFRSTLPSLSAIDSALEDPFKPSFATFETRAPVPKRASPQAASLLELHPSVNLVDAAESMLPLNNFPSSTSPSRSPAQMSNASPSRLLLEQPVSFARPQPPPPPPPSSTSQPPSHPLPTLYGPGLSYAPQRWIESTSTNGTYGTHGLDAGVPSNTAYVPDTRRPYAQADIQLPPARLYDANILPPSTSSMSFGQGQVPATRQFNQSYYLQQQQQQQQGYLPPLNSLAPPHDPSSRMKRTLSREDSASTTSVSSAGIKRRRDQLESGLSLPDERLFPQQQQQQQRHWQSTNSYSQPSQPLASSRSYPSLSNTTQYQNPVLTLQQRHYASLPQQSLQRPPQMQSTFPPQNPFEWSEYNNSCYSVPSQFVPSHPSDNQPLYQQQPPQSFPYYDNGPEGAASKRRRTDMGGPLHNFGGGVGSQVHPHPYAAPPHLYTPKPTPPMIIGGGLGATVSAPVNLAETLARCESWRREAATIEPVQEPERSEAATSPVVSSSKAPSKPKSKKSKTSSRKASRRRRDEDESDEEDDYLSEEEEKDEPEYIPSKRGVSPPASAPRRLTRAMAAKGIKLETDAEVSPDKKQRGKAREDVHYGVFSSKS